jgi:hypothetical protein
MIGGRIERCYNAGELNGKTAGGIVGVLSSGGVIKDCYNVGAISGTTSDSYVGGIVSRLVQGSIINVYNAGTVKNIYSGLERIGAIVGDDANMGSVTYAYYDADTSGAISAIGAKLETASMGRGNAAMRQRATFVNFDFTSSSPVWYITEGVHTPYLNGVGGQNAVVMHKVTFNGNGGTLVSGTELQYVPDGSAATPPVYSNPGYTLDGWSDTYDDIRGDKTLYARWTRTSYKVTFIGGAGSVLSGGSDVQYVNYGAAAVAPTFTRSGWLFVSWDKPFDNVTGDLTVYANWKLDMPNSGLVVTPGVNEKVLSVVGLPSIAGITYQYQWQRYVPSGSGGNWLDIPGATNRTLVIGKDEDETYYRCIVTAAVDGQSGDGANTPVGFLKPPGSGGNAGTGGGSSGGSVVGGGSTTGFIWTWQTTLLIVGLVLLIGLICVLIAFAIVRQKRKDMNQDSTWQYRDNRWN